MEDTRKRHKTALPHHAEIRRAICHGRDLRAGREHQLGDTENTVVTFAILTTTANEIMQPIHERMPVILPLGREKNWLPPDPSGLFLFPPFPSELMTAYPVTPKMNKASFNTPEAIAPFERAITA